MAAAKPSLERANSLYGLISAEARAGEGAGRLTDRAANALLEAGLFSMLIAKSDGGAEATALNFSKPWRRSQKRTARRAGVSPSARRRHS